MGYVSKTELMEALACAGTFGEDELRFMDMLIKKEKMDNDTILELGVINAFEEKGILRRFYEVCKEKGYFPFWVDNVKNGIDHV